MRIVPALAVRMKVQAAAWTTNARTGMARIVPALAVQTKGQAAAAMIMTEKRRMRRTTGMMQTTNARLGMTRIAGTVKMNTTRKTRPQTYILLDNLSRFPTHTKKLTKNTLYIRLFVHT